MEFKDYYATLGVTPSATQDEIKRAYRKLARKYHPDVSEESDPEARFKEVAEAHEALIDLERRAAYDDIGNRASSRVICMRGWESRCRAPIPPRRIGPTPRWRRRFPAMPRAAHHPRHMLPHHGTGTRPRRGRAGTRFA